MTFVLLAAGIYNVLWGVQAVCWPNWLFHWVGLTAPDYPEIWQCSGLVMGVWGFGYLAAAAYPVRNWPIVLAGLLSRVFEALGFLIVGAEHRLPWKFCGAIIANDVVWFLPLGAILWFAHKVHGDSRRYASPEIQRLALRTRTNKGQTLLEMSIEKPLLIIFLRTVDCPFCREALTNIAAERSTLKRRDVEVVLVHMGEDQMMHEFLLPYGLSDLPRVSDKGLSLYRAFGLRRGSLWSVVGPPVWIRGVVRLIQYGAGRLTPDLLQMPGVFMVFHGQVLWNFVHQSIADQPRYEDIPISS